MKRREQYQGFTLVELLMALAISSLLLSGLGMAFSASMTSYNVNKDTYEGLNNARLALARMVSELRTGHLIDLDASLSQCDFFNASNQDMGYDYRSEDKTLYIVTHADNKDYVLCRDVESATFTKIPTEDGAYCQSVHIDLTVSSGQVEQTFSQSVAVRRNQD
jgi:prepilin-type N-terminal cleavage/methylation domain-containing protein